MATLQDPKQRYQNKMGSVDVIPESGHLTTASDIR